MPKRDEELEYEYDEEAEGFDEDEYEDEEAYADDEYEDDDEDSEYEDDEYEDEEEAAGGGWMKKAVFAVAGLLVIGGGAYAYLQGMLPFSPKPEVAQEVVQPATGGFANPNGMGKIAPTPGLPAVDQAVPQEPPVAEAPKTEAAPPVAKDPAKAEPAQVAANQPAKVAPKPAAKPVKAAVAPPPKAAPKPVARAVVKPAVKPAVATAPKGAGTYAVQCGAFATAANADNLVRALGSKGFQAWVSNGSGQSSGAYSIRTTVVNSAAKAEALKAKFASAGHPGAIVPAGRGRYVLQLGIFSQRDRAEALAGEMRSKGLFVSVSGGTAKLRTASKVLVGRYPSMGQAQAAAAKVRREGVPAIVVRL